jgi:ribosomal protein S18 acetylase RimI-like enzyme
VSHPAVSIRRAESKDLEALTALLVELFSIEEDFLIDRSKQRRGLERMLNNPAGSLWAAEADGKVIGMCSGQLMVSTAAGGPSALVEDVVVDSPWRGRGVGKRLVQSVSQWASEQGAARLQLLADQTNHSALAFYEHLGWEKTQLVCLRKRMS